MIQEKSKTTPNSLQEKGFKELKKEVLAVLKGNKTSLCKTVLKELLEEGLDCNSLVE